MPLKNIRLFLKKTLLILTVQYLEKYSTTAGIQGPASSERARRITDCRRERRWKMGELKGHQQ